jgi:hypothetical protein
MNKKTRTALFRAALVGILAGAGGVADASGLLSRDSLSFDGQNPPDQGGSSGKVKAKHACKGQNSCKGKGGCKSSDNGCKGKNSCKGKGGCATDGSKMPDEKKPSITRLP